MAASPNLKNRFLLFIFFFLFVFSPALKAEIPVALSPELARDEAMELALNSGQENPPTQDLEKPVSENTFELPEWVRRTNFAIEAGTGIRPKYFFETIQPLLGTQNKETVFFNQSRVSLRDDRTTYNAGFGLRRIFQDSYLLGMNTFYDYQDLHQHHRAGVGFEAITDRGLEGRLNTYFGVSAKRLVQDDASGQHFEKVANGADWEIGGPLPYLPFLKLYGGGNWYSFEQFKDKFGWQMRMEYNPIKYSRLTFIMLKDNKRTDISYRFEGAMTLALTSFHPRDILNDIRVSQEIFPKINLRDKILDRVVRDFDITVITSTTSGGLTVEGGRA